MAEQTVERKRLIMPTVKSTFLAPATITESLAGRRKDKDLFVSQFVLDEAAAGDPVAAAEYLQLLDDLPLIDSSHPEVDRLADLLADQHLLPSKPKTDSQHVAVAKFFGIHYLMAWNCKHIANADRLPRIYSTLRS